jgi:hypothetical protein
MANSRPFVWSPGLELSSPAIVGTHRDVVDGHLVGCHRGEVALAERQAVVLAVDDLQDPLVVFDAIGDTGTVATEIGMLSNGFFER